MLDPWSGICGVLFFLTFILLFTLDIIVLIKLKRHKNFIIYRNLLISGGILPISGIIISYSNSNMRPVAGIVASIGPLLIYITTIILDFVILKKFEKEMNYRFYRISLLLSIIFPISGLLGILLAIISDRFFRLPNGIIGFLLFGFPLGYLQLLITTIMLLVYSRKVLDNNQKCHQCKNDITESKKFCGYCGCEVNNLF